VIGPNAKVAYTSGGGSAVLLSTRTVTPLEGITEAAKEFDAKVEYHIGVTSTNYKYLPLISDYMKSGDPGALVEFWNETPTEDFLKTDADLTAERPNPVWHTTTRSSNAFLTDGIDESVNEVCWVRYSMTFVPDETGDWEFSLVIVGLGNLFVNDKLVVDLSTNPEPGELFFGIGSKEVRAVVPGLEANKEYHLEIRTSNSHLVAKGTPFNSRGGIRAGAMTKIKEEDAINEAVDLAKKADATILVIGLNNDWESEGFDRNHMDLPGSTNDLVTQVLAASPQVVIVNQSGTPVTMPWIDQAHTLLHAFYGGDELGNGLADVIFGKVNPAGKLALTFPKQLEDNPSYPSFGDRGQVHGKVLYNEGIYAGYRSYGINKLMPLFPFGYGLSYTTFSYSDLFLTQPSSSDPFNVSFTVKNTGNVPGREVAQIYIADLHSSLPMPAKELKGFSKVYLRPGESETIDIELGRDAISFYDDRKKVWIAEQGIFEVQVGTSSADIKLKGEITLEQTFTWTGPVEIDRIMLSQLV
jgi:beta-glucosidase